MLVAAAAPVAYGSAFDKVLQDYKQDGKIDPCAHSAAVLQRAKKQIPNDVNQYAPNFETDLDRAIADRAAGACDNGKGGGGGNDQSAAGGTSGSSGSGGTQSGQSAQGGTSGSGGSTAPSDNGTSAGAGTQAPSTAATPGVIATPTPGTPAPPPVKLGRNTGTTRAVTAAEKANSGIPAPIIVLGIVLVLVALSTVALLIARSRGWTFAQARHQWG